MLQSDLAVCVWLPLYPLRCEEERRPRLRSEPTALLAPDVTKRVWMVSPLARRMGVRPGVTVSQAIGLCPALVLLEPDPVWYDERFARLLLALSNVSPVIEPAELGRAFVGVDGLEGLYGGPERVLAAVAAAVDCGLGYQINNPQSAIHNSSAACAAPTRGGSGCGGVR